MRLNSAESRKRHHSDHQQARHRVAGDMDQLLWCPISQSHFMGLMEALMNAAYAVERETRVDATCQEALDWLALFTDESETVAVDFTPEQIEEAWREYVELAR